MRRDTVLIALGLMTMSLLVAGCSSLPTASKGDGADSGQAGFKQFSDVPIPTGSDIKMERSVILGAHEAWTGRVVLSDWNGVASMYDFYKSHTPKYGWEEISTVRSAVSVLTYTRGERVLTVQIQSAMLWGSEIDLTVSPRGAAASTAGAPAMPPPVGRAPTIPVTRSP